MKAQAEALYKARKYTDAIPVYRAVVAATPGDLNAWSYLVLSLRNVGQIDEAATSAKEALQHHPRSSWLWAEVGHCLTDQDRFGEAEKALDQSRRLAPSDPWLWRYYGQLRRKQKNYGAEAQALEELVALDKANGHDLNRLGIAHHDNKNYGKALVYYRMSAAAQPDAHPYFNMGLVYSDPEVSQDADAADAYRRALRIDPNYARATERLAGIKRKLGPLAIQALSESEGLVRPEEYYQHYLNPFEVLRIEPASDMPDPKEVQRAKKKLLQELELNDGKVGWLGDQAIDRARVLAIDDELLDPDKRAYHAAIFRHEPLLRFLTHGSITHFLYSEEYFPVEALELIDEGSELPSLLSKPFAAQYNTVLTRAIGQQALSVVEVLFDGRRWVRPDELDLCLSGAFKRVDQYLQMMKELNRESTTRLVDDAEVRDALDSHAMTGLFNLLPVQFRTHQTKVVEIIRSLALNCHNKHGETRMSKNILSLCKGFQFKSHALNELLKKDYEQVEKLIEEQAAVNAHRVRQTVRPKQEAHARPVPGGSAPPAETTPLKGAGWGLAIIVLMGIYVVLDDPALLFGYGLLVIVVCALFWRWIMAINHFIEAIGDRLKAEWRWAKERYRKWQAHRSVQKPTGPKTTRATAPTTSAATAPTNGSAERWREIKSASAFIGLISIAFLFVFQCNKGSGDLGNRPHAMDRSSSTSQPNSRPSGDVLFREGAEGNSASPDRTPPASSGAEEVSPSVGGKMHKGYADAEIERIQKEFEKAVSGKQEEMRQDLQKHKYEPIQYKPLQLEPIEPTSPIKLKPAPSAKEDWKSAAYSNGDAPECFNYTPRHDRSLDNQLRVVVGGGTDVVIKLMQYGTDRCIRYVYINSQSKYAIRNIPEGRYYLKIAYGKRWVERKDAGMCIGKFSQSPLYEKGSDILDFRKRSTGITYEHGQQYENYEIPSYEIQLDVVTTGYASNSLNTGTISEDEFNR